MKKINYFGMACVAVSLAACSSEDFYDLPQAPQQGFSVKAFMNNGDTRATANKEDNKHKFAWQEGDEIGVYNGSTITKLTLSESAETANGVFSGESEVEGITSAVYPYNEAHKYADGAWTMTLPASYQYSGAYTGNVNCPMIATVAEANAAAEDTVAAPKLQFNHLAGAIRFDVLSLPSSANEVVLTLPGKKINGEFAVSNDVIQNADSSEANEQSISIKFSQQDADAQSSVFFFPVPTGSYTSLKFEVKANDQVLNSYENATQFTIAKNDMAQYPVITIGGEMEDFLKVIEEGGSFTLAKDMEVDAFTLTKETTFDLNGHKLSTKDNSSIIINNTKLTVKDRSTDANGQIAAPVSVGYAPANNDIQAGELVLESGVITFGEGNAAVVMGKNGKFTMNGGSVINTGYNFAIGTNNLSKSENASITINGGTVESQGDYAIFVADNMPLKIEGGSLKGYRGVVAIDKGSVEITGGTFESECVGEASGTTGTGSFPGAIIAAPCYYDNVSVKVSGGTFNGKTGISTEKVGDRKNQGANYATTVAVTGGTWQDPEVLNYAAEGAKVDVVLANDVEIKKAIEVKAGTATIDFAGHTITNKTDMAPTSGSTPSSYGFDITGASTEVTFNNSGNAGGITIDGSNSDADAYRQALLIHLGAKVVINGGRFYNTQKTNAQLDLIQVGGGASGDAASLTVNGGEFESGCYSTFGGANPRYWVLNVKNANKETAKIEVKGGKFINFNPAKPGTDDNESYLASGCKVTVDKEGVDASKAYYEAVAEESGETKTKLTYTVSAE